MCLAIPAQLVELTGGSDVATVDVLGVKRRINVALLQGEPLAVGDWVLVHVGFAMSRMDEAEARATLALLEELGQPLADELGTIEQSDID